MAYMEGLGQKKQRFKELSHEQLQSGVVRVRIMKQYNNNAFPDDAVKGGE
jgi:hypothetical protein